MDKRTHATINNEELHIGDFVVVGLGSAERVYRTVAVHFTADEVWLSVWSDAGCSTYTQVKADQVTGVLLESEVTMQLDGRFKRAD